MGHRSRKCRVGLELIRTSVLELRRACRALRCLFGKMGVLARLWGRALGKMGGVARGKFWECGIGFVYLSFPTLCDCRWGIASVS